MKTIPGVLIDIDGVIFHDGKPIPGALEALKFLKTPISFVDEEKTSEQIYIPFSFVTNSGGKLEGVKADSINHCFNITDHPYKILKEDVIMNFTPLRPVFKDFKDKLVLALGFGDIESILQDCGVKRYITVDEYTVIFPTSMPEFKSAILTEETTEIRKRVFQRLNLSETMSANDLDIQAVFVLNEPVDWHQSIQIICDVVGRTDKRVHKSLENNTLDHIPVFSANNDFLYSGAFKLPRFANGAFNAMLKFLYLQQYNHELNISLYCKPETTTFKYAEKFLQNKTTHKISNIYMIGDNPKSDIRGANKAGFVSILTRTGVFQGEINDPEDPATYVVQNIYEAIQLICKLEGIKFP